MTKWTDWMPHDGKGVPAELKVGMIVEAEGITPDGKQISITQELEASDFGGNQGSWLWTNLKYNRVTRYRIRKPRALQDMIKMVEALPVVKHLEKTA